MQRLALAVLALALAPGAALAQQSAGTSLASPTYLTPASSSAPTAAPTGAPTGVDPELAAQPSPATAPSPAAAASRATTWRVETPYRAPAVDSSGPNFAESLGHAWAGFGIGTGGGGAVGALAGCAVTAIFGGCPFGALYGAPIGAILFAPIGAALGAWGWGELAGGNGNFFASLGLSFIGAGAGVGAAWLVSDTTQSGWGALVGPLTGAVLSTLGAAAGYQLSMHDSPNRMARRAPDFVLSPTIAPTEHRDGATVGVAGIF